MTVTTWVLLAYRLPREPSTPRITLWRQLRRLGVAQLADGLVALPLDARTREHLEWLADDVIEHGGEATIWLGQPGSAAQERAIAERMAGRIVREYEALAAEAMVAGSRAGTARTLARLRRALRQTAARDYFASPWKERARATIEALAQPVEAAS